MTKVKGKPPTDPQSLTMMQFDELLERGQVKGNLQLSHVLGNSLGQHPQPFVAAANHGVHTGTLGRTRRGKEAAALIITCTGREAE